ncbi:hypothetical protein HUU59_10295 [bacterium]|nr:hypothetical protein [bacterium]
MPQLMSRRWVAGLVFAVSLVPTLFGLVGEERMLAASFHDDAYYYFRIAENIAAGNGSTFDGTNPTNGYQPLWCWLLVPIAALKVYIFPGSYLLVYGLFIAGLTALAALLIMKVAEQASGVIAAMIAGSLLLYGRTTTLFTGGMEGTVLGVFILLYVMTLLKQADISSAVWLLGLLGAGIVLSRVDHAIVVSGLGLFALRELWTSPLHPSRVKMLKKCLPIILLPFAALIFYFAGNWVWFGHAMPISGAIKTTGELSFRPELWLRDKGVLLLCVSSFALLVWFALRTRLGRQGPDVERVFFHWALGNAMYMMFLLVSVRWVLANWYFVSPLLQLAVVIGWGVERALMGISRGRTAVQWGAAMLLGVFILKSQISRFEWLNRSEGTFQTEVIEAAKWCNEHLQNDAVIGLADAGYFGYHSRHQVTNLDGLVNGWDYVEACRGGNGVEYLRRQGVTHVATVFGSQITHDGGRMSYEIPAVFAAKNSGNRFTASEQSLVYRSSYGQGTSFSGEIVLWEDR